MKIKITEFAKRHFDPKFGGTKILDHSIEEFENKTNVDKIFKSLTLHETIICPVHLQDDVRSWNGYAPFCKLVAIRNFTNAKLGVTKITFENYQYIISGYSARRETELPVFSRWLELPIEIPKAKHLILVLYDKEQIEKENKVDALKKYEKEKKEYDDSGEEDGFILGDGFPDNFDDWCELLDIVNTFDADYGIVAILGQETSEEEPMKPETMLRNALGIEEGGSGVKLDRKKYLESVKFWSENITIKS